MSERQLVNPKDTTGLCKVCGSPARPLISDKNPLASEFYCVKCDKSELMTEREHTIMSDMRKRQGGR